MTPLSESPQISPEPVRADDEWWVGYIPKQEAENLKSSCEQLGIFGEDFDGIYYLTAVLRSFEKTDKPTIPTIKQRIGAIKNAIDAGDNLRMALDAIYTEDSSGYLFRARIGFDVEFERVQDCLRKAFDSLDSKTKTGRRALLDEYSMFIGFFWKRVKGKGFALGRNNDFHRLCDAAFVAAGVPSSAEGALRRFIEKGMPPIEGA